MTDRAPISARITADGAQLLDSLIPQVNRFRKRQTDNGAIPEPTLDDAALLRAIRDDATLWYRGHRLDDQAGALVADVNDWIAHGLDSTPHFARSRDALQPPADGSPVFFLGSVHTANSVPPVGKRLECFFAVRKEPDGLPGLAETHPHPKNNCQSLVLVAGSDGFAHGNCVVFFPENVSAQDDVTDQSYAMFFYNKLRRIHETYAVPGAEAVLTADSVPRASSGLAPHTFYQARATWGYLHDSMHYQGRWPFDQHIALKMNWFVGLLEEIKVDAKTVIACASGEVPFAQEQIDMILLERVFRYPQADDATRNFDSGTGVFLYSWLREHGALLGSSQNGAKLVLDREGTLDALRSYVTAVEALESQVDNSEEYRAAAKALVRTYLPEGERQHRYRFTNDQQVLLRAKAMSGRRVPLRFTEAEW